MGQAALTRLAVLLAAAACAAIAIGLLPSVRTGFEVAPAPAVIVNDTSAPVVVAHCAGACPAAGGTTLSPGRELPAGLPHALWQVRTPEGEVIGCLSGGSAAQRLRVSRAQSCPG